MITYSTKSDFTIIRSRYIYNYNLLLKDYKSFPADYERKVRILEREKIIFNALYQKVPLRAEYSNPGKYLTFVPIFFSYFNFDINSDSKAWMISCRGYQNLYYQIKGSVKNVSFEFFIEQNIPEELKKALIFNMDLF